MAGFFKYLFDTQDNKVNVLAVPLSVYGAGMGILFGANIIGTAFGVGPLGYLLGAGVGFLGGAVVGRMAQKGLEIALMPAAGAVLDIYSWVKAKRSKNSHPAPEDPRMKSRLPEPNTSLARAPSPREAFPKVASDRRYGLTNMKATAEPGVSYDRPIKR